MYLINIPSVRPHHIQEVKPLLTLLYSQTFRLNWINVFVKTILDVLTPHLSLLLQVQDGALETLVPGPTLEIPWIRDASSNIGREIH